jgi:hypothetical protein
MRNTDHDAVHAGLGLSILKMTEVAEGLLLERLEATAAPEHERHR